MVTPPVTGVLIVAPTALHRAAWAALLAQQPDVRVAGALADPTQLTALVSSSAPTTVLLDLPIPFPDLVRQWHAVCATRGILVRSHPLTWAPSCHSSRQAQPAVSHATNQLAISPAR